MWWFLLRMTGLLLIMPCDASREGYFYFCSLPLKRRREGRGLWHYVQYVQCSTGAYIHHYHGKYSPAQCLTSAPSLLI